MSPIDQREQLIDQPFGYRTSKDGQVFIQYRGRRVLTLRGDDARRLLARLATLDEAGQQLALAKATGNFKRGNERNGKRQR
ncbi:MAG TPA: hypothetical protein VIL85_21500 [Thermomicrobiales bacterium]|jgi:hypothetical protein